MLLLAAAGTISRACVHLPQAAYRRDVGLANASLAAEETKISKAKLNRFDPVLSSNAYIGRIKENERLVQLEPRLFATDVDASNSPNGTSRDRRLP